MFPTWCYYVAPIIALFVFAIIVLTGFGLWYLCSNYLPALFDLLLAYLP